MELFVGYQRLLVWQKADGLVLMVYKASATFPRSEIFSITSQLRRAALSVPTNIVEGYARNSKSEFKRFLVIALGSLAETKYLLDVSVRLGYLTKDIHAKLVNLTEEIGKMLWSLHKSQKLTGKTVA